MHFLKLLLTIILCAVSKTSSPNSDVLFDVSKETYQAVKDKDGEAMRKLTSAQFRFVGSHGVLNLKEVVQATKDCELRSFRLFEPSVQIVNQDTVVLTYRTDQDMSCGQHAAARTLVNADVFSRLHNNWLVSTHFEAAADQ